MPTHNNLPGKSGGERNDGHGQHGCRDHPGHTLPLGERKRP